MLPPSFLPPLPVLAVQVVAAVLWTGTYVVWSRAYYRVLDPWLRRRVGAWVGGEVSWVYRVGSFHTGRLSFTRRSSWSWGLAGERTETTVQEAGRATLRDFAVYICFLLCVPIFAGLWPVAILLYVGLWRHALSVVVLLPLLFLVGPLYIAHWDLRDETKPPPGTPTVPR